MKAAKSFIATCLLPLGFLIATLTTTVQGANTIRVVPSRVLQENGEPRGLSADVDLDYSNLESIPEINFTGLDGDIVFKNLNTSSAGWHGESEAMSATIIHSNDGGIAGVFSDKKHVYSMNTLSDGTVIVNIANEEEFIDEEVGIDHEDEDDEGVRRHLSVANQLRGALPKLNEPPADIVPRDAEHARKLQGAHVVHVLVIFSQAAMCTEAGGNCNDEGPIRNMIQVGENQVNDAMELSGANTRIKIVHVHRDQSGFNEAEGDITHSLRTLQNEDYRTQNNDMDYLSQMRDDYGADMVSLIIELNGSCGYGNVRGPFSVAKRACAWYYFSFAHELAHGFGCYHNREVSNTQHQFAHGYQDPNRNFRSITAYNCPNGGCSRVQRYSNVYSQYSGLPIGRPDVDCARQIDEYAGTVAGWRPETPLGGGTTNICRTDPDNWHDSDGAYYNCDWYAQGNRCSTYGNTYANMGKTAQQACCQCGGGRHG